MNNLRAGIAESKIKLNPGMDMTGYIARQAPADGTHDPLKIRCLLLDDGATRFVLVVCDLLGLSRDFTSDTAEMIERQTCIPARNVVIACIHTHSGPASIFLQDCGAVDEDWLGSLQQSIVGCVETAAGRLKPSALSYATSSCDIGRNRAAKRSDSLNSIDRQVAVLLIRDACTGKADALLVNYACHPVVLTEKNLFFSADFPSYTVDALERELGYDACAIFTLGCGGDINPIEGGTFCVAEKIGNKLADSVIQNVLRNPSRLCGLDPVILVKSISVTLPLSHNLDENNLIQGINLYQEQIEMAKKAGDIILQKASAAYLHWAENMLRRMNEGGLEREINVELKMIRIGELIIISIPFEVFHGIGARIKEHFGLQNTLVLSLANGDYGYLPSKDLYDNAEYETRQAFKFYGYPGPICREAEDILCDSLFRADTALKKETGKDISQWEAE